MKWYHIGLFGVFVATWMNLGVILTNYVFPGYSCAPANMNHFFFMLGWGFIPPIAGLVLIDHLKGDTEDAVD